MKKKILIVCFVCFYTLVFSQEKGHYLSGGINMGKSGYRYTFNEGKAKGQLGMGCNIGYQYYFHKHWGLGTGLGIHSYSTNGIFSNYQQYFENEYDSENDMYTEEVTLLSNWKENQNGIFLEIPLLLAFQKQFKSHPRIGIYAHGGVKAEIPLSSRFKVSSGEMEFSGIYEQWNITLSDLPEHGFGVEKSSFSGKVKVKTGFSLTAGVGMLVALKEYMDLFFGAYCDYGISDIYAGSEGEVLYADGSGTIQYRSILSSSLINKNHMLSIGGEIGLRCKLGKKSKREKHRNEDAYSGNTGTVIKADIEAYSNQSEKEAERLRNKFSESDKEKDTTYIHSIDDQRINKEYINVVGRNRIVLYDYDVNQTKLNPSMKLKLDKKAQLLKLNPDFMLICEGHTCDLESKGKDQQIGLKRAEEVRIYLEKKGVQANRIKVISKGDLNPVLPNTSEANRKINRRVVFVIQK